MVDSEEQNSCSNHKYEMGKAPGPDGILAEMVKCGGKTITQRMMHLYKQCLRQKQIPEEWNQATVVLLPKKGDRNDLQNYRPISLLSMLYKTFTNIQTARLEKQLNNEQPSKQAGFRCQFSTITHIHTLCQIMEKAREYNQQPVCLGFAKVKVFGL